MVGITRKLFSLIAAGALLLIGVASLFHARPAGAVTIEGYTPSGNFQTVYVGDDGRLFVSIDSTTPQHVIVDGGTITVKNILSEPVQVTGLSGGPVSVTGNFTATASTATTSVSGQTNVGNVAAIVYPADNLRKQGVLCNNDLSGLTLWVGPGSVTTGNGLVLFSGACMSPDVPSSFIGSVYAVSSGPTVATSYIYFK